MPSFSTGGGAAAAPARAKLGGAWAEPGSPEDATLLIVRLANYLRTQDPTLVAPYLLLRALRWGELRWQGDSLDEAFLASPSTEIRQQLRGFWRESNWEELLKAGEAAMGTTSGRAWLDLQRYAWEACYNLSYSAVAKAICSETRALLQDYPDLGSMNLNDGTAAADKQTLEWISSQVLPPAPEHSDSTSVIEYAERDTSGENGHADYFEVAMQLAKAGHVADAIDGFWREAARENSGRERFRRQLQLAQLCLSTQHFALAYPILQGLAQDIERRNLLEWEDPSLLSQVLAMLVQCIDRTTRDQEERGRVYALLCRLGPAAALQFERS
jgi:type VI secretion system protein ImpA